MRKFFIVAISIAVLFGIAACKPNTPIATLSLSAATLQLKVGDMSTIETSGTATNIEWSSSDEEVATVYYGVVTAKSIGKTVVKAYSGDGELRSRADYREGVFAGFEAEGEGRVVKSFVIADGAVYPCFISDL